MRQGLTAVLGGLGLALFASSAGAQDNNPTMHEGANHDDDKMDTLGPEDTRDPVETQTPTMAPPAPPPVQREIYSERVVEPVVVQPTVVQPTVVQPVIVRREGFRDRWGMAVSAGGGVNDFTGDAMRDITGTGGSWDARLALGTRQLIGFEAAYLGTAQSIDAIGLETDALLVSNGAEALVRVNLLPGPLQPYAFGGVAWKRYDLTNTDTNTSDVVGSDDVYELPLGVGVNAKSQGLIFDVRGAYRIATGEDLVPDRDIDDARDNEGFSALDNFNVSGHVGVEF